MKLRIHATWALASVCLSVVACSAQQDETEPSESLSSDLSLSGTTFTAAQSKWTTHIRDSVVPRLAGTQAERARRAAIVTWWALKEGVLDKQPSPYRHNLCTRNGKDVTLGDLEICAPGSTWQVGISGIQLPNVTDAAVIATAQSLYPGKSLASILGSIAQAAGIDPASTTGKAIVASTGRLQASWLLRDPAIGITMQVPFADDCVNGGPGWCYGFWPEAQTFASSLSRIQRVIGDLQTYFTTAAPPPGGGGSDPCANATLGDGAYCATYFSATAEAKTLLSCVGKKTANTTTCSNGCQRMPDGQDDKCAAAAASSVRAAMMTRAEAWRAAKMPYCGATPGNFDGICGKTCTERQTASLLKPEWNIYRSDCSGYVSFVWQLAFEDGHRTWGFAPFNDEGPAFSEVIAPSALQPGDVLNSATPDIFKQHIILFAGWVDQANGYARTLEEANCDADLVDTPKRKLVINKDGSVSLEGRAFWPVRKIGVP
jgi:hypothetical protein